MQTNNFPDSTHQTVAWFKNRSDQNELVIKPRFQRNPVWLTPQKSLLIDSILKGYPIPELYLQSTIDEYGTETWIVVDGQQRIRAFLEFIEGEYSLTPSEVPSHPDMRFADLAPEDRKRIYSYTFVIRTLPDMPEEQLRTMFTRLNRNNVALNKQELRHATYWGEFISMVNEISDRPFWVGAGLFTSNDFRRMLDREYVSELVVAVLHGPQNKKDTLDKWYAAYEEEFDGRRNVERTFDVVTAEIDRLLPDIKELRWSKKSDFYTLFLTLSSHYKDLPLASDRANLASEKLMDFSSQVDQFLKAVASPTDVPLEVIQYSSAVERAASDLNNRRTRSLALEKVLEDGWPR